MTPVLIAYPLFRAADNNNNPLANGLVWTYQPNTSTPQATWSDPGLTVLNPNPVVLNSRGEAFIYTNIAVDLILTAPGGNPTSPIWGPVTYGAPTTPYLIGDAVSGTVDNNYSVPTLLGSANPTSMSQVNMLVWYPDINSLATLISQTFTGTGINDGNFYGPYVGSTAGSVFSVTIDGVGNQGNGGGLASISLIAAGSGYSVNDILTLAGGTGGKVIVTTIGTSGVVTGLQIYEGGSGYVNWETTSAGGSNTGSGFTVNIDATSGAITSASIGAAGTNYVVGDVLTVISSPGSGGLVQITSIGTGGAVSGVSIIEPGSGYVTANGLATTYAVGTGCQVQITVSTLGASPTGVVTGISLYQGGTGYAVGQILKVSGGVGLTVQVTSIDANGAVTGLLMVGGFLYVVNTGLLTSYGGAGTGCEVNITSIGPGGTVTSISLNANPSSGYAVGDVLAVTGPSGSGGCTVQVTSIGTAGAVTGIQLVGGSGYATAVATSYGGAGVGCTVQITSLLTIDTFNWQKDGGTLTRNVAITPAVAQSLIEGISILFATGTGHTLGNIWAQSVMTPVRLNLCGLTPPPNGLVYKNLGGILQALGANDLQANYPAICVYAPVTNIWELINPQITSISPTGATLPPQLRRRLINAAYLTSIIDFGVELSCSGGPTITLAPCSAVPWTYLWIKNLDTPVVTVQVNGAPDLIYNQGSSTGVTSISIPMGMCVMLATNGVDWHILSISPSIHGVANFFTPGQTIWTCPAWVTTVWLTGSAAGGAGGAGGFGASLSTSNGTGGSAGQSCYKKAQAVTPGTAYTVTIPNAASANGDNCSFGTLLVLIGGIQGQNYQTSGVYVLTNDTIVKGGAGQGGMFGTGGSLNIVAAINNSGSYGYNGFDAMGYGAGGGGGVGIVANLSYRGGNGAPGFLIVEW